jgi:hypothetical protein
MILKGEVVLSKCSLAASDTCKVPSKRCTRMARYVVLSFDDNDLADDFVIEQLQDGTTVEGVFAKPTQFCEAGGCGTGRIKAFVRGRKFGWWVCSNCHKPSGVGKERLMHHVVSQGVNLLPDIKQAPASIWTRGWGVANRG